MLQRVYGLSFVSPLQACLFGLRMYLTRSRRRAYGDAMLDVLEPKHHAMMRALSARERARDAANNRSYKTSDAVGIAGFLKDRERNRNGG